MDKNGRTEMNSPCVMILFGASGDLAWRKLITSLYNLECAGLLQAGFKIVGFARTQMGQEEFRAEMKGGPTLFWRGDGIEAAWKVVEPILNTVQPPDPYDPGTWGPERAEKLVTSDGRAWVVE
jgi:glucose-6-phosphate 1-dehydrogenase